MQLLLHDSTGGPEPLAETAYDRSSLAVGQCPQLCRSNRLARHIQLPGIGDLQFQQLRTDVSTVLVSTAGATDVPHGNGSIFSWQ